MDISVDNLRSVVGIGVILLSAWLLSSARKAIVWRPVVIALGLQASIGAVLVLSPGVRAGLAGLTDGVAALQTATAKGTQFAFGYLAGGPAPY